MMATEEQLFHRFEAELAAIARLDRRYYLNPSPTLDERRDYAQRQMRLEEARSRFYKELGALRHYGVSYFRRCRSIIRKSGLFFY
jgi:hypothetical protein